MPLWANFCAAAYRAQSANIATDQCVNVYLETTRNAADPKKAVLLGTPGMRARFDTGLVSSVGRGLFSQDGRVLAVHGATFYEYLPASNSRTGTATIANDGKKVTFASNGIGGNQVAVCSAGSLYIFSLTTGTLSAAVSLPFVPGMVGYMDGYFLANEVNTNKMWFSNLENGSVWSATDYFARSSTSDNIVGFAVNNRRIWVIGSKTTEIFQDSGDPTTPFIPYPGTVVNEGTNAPASIVSVADTVFWAGSTNEFGASQVFAASTLLPRTISTTAISAQISQSTNATEAEALAYTQNGHDFICWTWPSIEQTWCYDLTEDCWHQRLTWNATDPSVPYASFARWGARATCSYNPPGGGQPAVLVVQWNNAVLCQFDLTYNSDYNPTGTSGAPQPILRQRDAPYLSAENQWLFVHQLELGLSYQLGGLPAGELWLGLSNGPTLITPLTPAAPTLQLDGTAVAQWFQVGRYRADRLRIAIRQIGDPVVEWGPGLYLRATPGTGLL